MEELVKANITLKEQATEVDFVLIGAGLPRTGTASTCSALEKLLPGKCHHMKRAFTGSQDAIFWPRAARGELLEEDWKQFITSEGLSAAVDYPMSLYWKDLLKMYPNAKVLLTDRDPVKWYLSVRNTIRQAVSFIMASWGGFPLRLIGRLLGRPVGPALFTCTAPTYLGAKYPQGMFGAVDAGEETAVKFFNDWKAEVIREVPADRLLVFEVKQGWAPLCKFLGVPQPDGPYPNVNDTKEQQEMLGKMKKICFLFWSVAAASVGAAVYFFKDSVPMPNVTFN
eukprot:GFUD01010101.1.p1 GENE.GFUD01010101.1~~GFUD01010101.1.p1  ORF type:complete len:282 (+),score=55.81 GFUD01010101.1:104-949(+)